MASISFLFPLYLFFLFLIPLFIFIHLVTMKSTRATALKFANFDAIAKIKGVDFISKSIFILVLSILIVLLLSLSLAGTTLHTEIDAASYSFVLALDTSKSMEADDIAPNRMGAAKTAAENFVDFVPLATRVGVISFSGNALIEQDLTDSKILMKQAIRNIEISEIAGSDLAEAVITGTNLLKGDESRAIILLSDGQINVGGIDEIIDYANKNNVVVHTIGIGTEEGGRTSYGFSKLDEDTLKALAFNTGGEFFRAVDEAELDLSFRNGIDRTRRKVSINLSSYLLIAAILLFALEYYLINSRYRRLV